MKTKKEKHFCSLALRELAGTGFIYALGIFVAILMIRSIA